MSAVNLALISSAIEFNYASVTGAGLNNDFLNPRVYSILMNSPMT